MISYKRPINVPKICWRVEEFLLLTINSIREQFHQISNVGVEMIENLRLYRKDMNVEREKLQRFLLKQTRFEDLVDNYDNLMNNYYRESEGVHDLTQNLTQMPRSERQIPRTSKQISVLSRSVKLIFRKTQEITRGSR